MEYLNEEGLAALWEDTKEYVEKYHGENSGEQESDGTEAGPISELTAKGHAEQYTTLGKNLIPATLNGIKAANATIAWSGNSCTIEGITYTVNGDMSVTCNGTATGLSTLAIAQNFSVPSGTYILSGCPKTGSDSTYKLGYSGAGYDTGNGIPAVNPNVGSVFTYVASGVTVSNLTFYPQLEMGSTATSYEPYTGGAPSPSPDYPQEIQVVKGRNLLDASVLSTWAFQGGNIFSVDSDKSVTILKADSAPEAGESQFISLAAGTYTISVENPCRLQVATNRVKIIDTGANVFSSTYATFTLNESSDTVHFKFLYSFYPYELGHIQLERGSVAHGYVPYGDYVGLEVRTRNLLDTSSWVVPSNGDSQRVFTLNLEPNTRYCLSSNVPDSSVAGGGLLYFVNSTESASYVSNGVYNGRPRVTTTNSDGIINVIRYTRGYITDWSDWEIQLEKGDHATEYVMHYTPIPIPLPSRGWAAGLPDGTADTLTLDGAGKVAWKLNTNKYICTGNETLADAGNLGNGYWRVWLASVLNANKSVGNVDNLLCTHSIGRIAYKEASNHVYISSDGGSILCYAKANDANGVLVAFTGAEFIYPLATPVTEQRGYVDLPDIPEGASLSIPELDDLGVKYHVDGAASTLAHQWYERAHSEYEGRIAALEEAVAEIIAG